IWMDNDWRRKGWNLADFTKNYFSPADFGASVRSALRVSDEYVWIYTEQPRWWTKEKLPQAYVDASASARKRVRGAAIREWLGQILPETLYGLATQSSRNSYFSSTTSTPHLLPGFSSTFRNPAAWYKCAAAFKALIVQRMTLR